MTSEEQSYRHALLESALARVRTLTRCFQELGYGHDIASLRTKLQPLPPLLESQHAQPSENRTAVGASVGIFPRKLQQPGRHGQMLAMKQMFGGPKQNPHRKQSD